MAMAGSAVGTWWMMSRQRARVVTPAHDRGTVIFDNTPTPADVDPVI